MIGWEEPILFWTGWPYEISRLTFWIAENLHGKQGLLSIRSMGINHVDQSHDILEQKYWNIETKQEEKKPTVSRNGILDFYCLTNKSFVVDHRRCIIQILLVKFDSLLHPMKQNWLVYAFSSTITVSFIWNFLSKLLFITQRNEKSYAKVWLAFIAIWSQQGEMEENITEQTPKQQKHNHRCSFADLLMLANTSYCIRKRNDVVSITISLPRR